METQFTVLSWNIEHFKIKNRGNTKESTLKRKNRIMQKIKDFEPDIFAIYEVEGKEVFDAMMQDFPNHHIHITEGPQTQEILVGVHKDLNSFFTQKLEFKSGSSYLRPGALLTIKIKEEYYTLLFLHTKSGNDPKGFGLRDDMLHKAIKFRRNLDKKSLNPKGAKYIFLGDLNTMGMNYYKDNDIDYETEMNKNVEYARRYYDIELLTKTHPYTFYNGSKSSYPKSNLDHVFASDHIKFKSFKGLENPECQVKVDGWVNFDGIDEQDQWIKDFSDHSLLYFEVVE
jgi:endonuclease/exonuclease/phosphatase family metal-dependent hydrolase